MTKGVHEQWNRLLTRYNEVYEKLDEYTDMHDWCYFDYVGYCEDLDRGDLTMDCYVHLSNRVSELETLLKTYKKLEEFDCVYS